MPIAGLGVHLLVALFFAVHAVRTKREMYWLLVLFSFPLLGSVVYFFAIFLPQSRLERTLGKAGGVVLEKLDPGRATREAQNAFDLAPTAFNQTRLATAMLEAGLYSMAVEQFDACLRGPFSDDPEIRFAAAQARLANGQAGDAVEALLALRKSHPGFREEQVGVQLARSFAGAGMHAEAGLEFAAVVERFCGIEARAEYALWALSRRDAPLAEVLLKELNHARKHMSRHTRSLHHKLFKRVDAAVAQQGR